MLKYIVVREYIDPDKSQKLLGSSRQDEGLRHLLGVMMANAGCMK